MMDPKREKLLKAKLGDLLAWKKPQIVETVGPYDPTVFDGYDALLQRVIAECTKALAGYTEAEIEILAGKPDEVHQVRFRWSALMIDEIRRLNRNRPPPWYAGGFGHPGYAADFEQWSKMASFTIHELLCLSVGVDPGSFSGKSIAETAALPKLKFDGLWPALQLLVRRREQLMRQFSPGEHERRVRPEPFIFWAEKVAFDVHPEFLRLLRRYHVEEAIEPPATVAPSRQDPREVDTIAQLFTAMAIDQLGYDPKAVRSPIPKEIAEIAASMGLEVSDGTVRKYLKLGASFIPKDWKAE